MEMSKIRSLCWVIALSLTWVGAADGDVKSDALQQAFSVNHDGSVTVDGDRFESMEAYQLSDKFKFEGRRCKAEIMPVGRFDKSTSDCTKSQTVIQSEYDSGGPYVVPIVFHIITDTNGQGDISNDLIQSQVDILNEDFGAQSGSPGSAGYDTGIRFELAGITRTAHRQWFADRRESQYKGQLGWDQDRYLNVYTNEASGYLGYAYFPQDAAGGTLDGVVLNWTAVGRDAPYGGIYDQGRTATHEIGHYFGLYHTFQGGCSNSYTSGDLIVDTNAETTARYECQNYTSCGSPDPINNYMDYTNDTCMDHFTQEQANRVVCGLLNYRPLLYGGGSGGNQSPNADFDSSANGLSVSFTDQSSDPDGTLVAWAWTFGDGSTSSAQDPSHSYAANGTYLVGLTVTDNEGATASTSQNISVSDGSGSAIQLSASGYKVKGKQKADLTWSGASGSAVDVYRDGELITSTQNDGFFTDNIDVKGGGVSYTYLICDLSNCSIEATVVF